MRFAVALAVVAVAWAGAVYVHQRHIEVTVPAVTPAQVDPKNCSNYQPGGFGSAYCGSLAQVAYRARTHPSWEDPVAVLLAIGGLAVAVGIVASGRRGS